MKSRRLLFLLCFFLSACQTPSIDTPPVENPGKKSALTTSQEYMIQQKITLDNIGDSSPDKQNLWVALIRDLDPYQVVDSRIISPDQYQIVTDEFANQYAEFDFSDHPAGTKIVVEIEYQVTVFEQVIDLSNCEGPLPDNYTAPELHIESLNPQILSLSNSLSQDQDTVCGQVRAFYDYIGDELVYTYNQNDWGAQAALGKMGADCTEYSSLMIALSRAAGIPARYFEGLLYKENLQEGIAQTEHAWLDVYLPNAGWSAMDPTLGRSLINRNDYFAHHTPEHIIVTLGRNPSVLRGSNYWSHLYWPGDSTTIRVESAEWIITSIE